VYIGHSPFFVLGNVPVVPACPATFGETHDNATAVSRSAGAKRTMVRRIAYTSTIERARDE
jgi:hypothetical protein